MVCGVIALSRSPPRDYSGQMIINSVKRGICRSKLPVTIFIPITPVMLRTLLSQVVEA
jgi:hypothetical protein